MGAVMVHENCVTALARMPEASVDAIVCDPPYGLEFMGKEWDKLGGDRRQRGDAAYKQGDARHGLVRHGGTASYGVDPSQAGQAMQASHVAWAREALRVLKPGGHLLAFGGSRTVHRLACAIEDAGFEIRDSIVWMYGQGFPKSLDISRAIDKAAGAEREVVGTYTARGFSDTSPTADGRNQWAAGDVTDKVAAITAPATDDARRWEGWGTALKPAQEIIVVARKPPSERTVAANVVKHGTGALNIDGCRIATAESLNGGAYSPGEREPVSGDTRSDTAAGMYGRNGRVKGGTWQSEDRSGGQGSGFRPGVGEFVQPPGRWPANVVLSHVPDDFDADGNEVPGCQCVGTREVKRDLLDATAAVNTSDGWGNMQGSRSLGTTTETLPVWECVPGCPVAALDAQSGPAGADAPASGPTLTGPTPTGTAYGARNGLDRPPAFHADSGGAARFFYQSKATNRERWGYCHDCDVVFNRGVKADRAEHKPHRVEYHPTVKPVDLMRWLVRLVTPPGGTVLDPFAGTGTTGEAAITEGFQFIGIEREPTYFRIADARVTAWAR